jgi:hypothetical protein
VIDQYGENGHRPQAIDLRPVVVGCQIGVSRWSGTGCLLRGAGGGSEARDSRTQEPTKLHADNICTANIMLKSSTADCGLYPSCSMSDRRQRIHDLVLALLAQQGDLELLAGDGSGLPSGDAGNWIERNRRVVQRYQALVRSAVTLDALVDQEVSGGFQNKPDSAERI